MDEPSGVQFASPMRPPGRTTRVSSLATGFWFGANITPKVERLLSALPIS